MNLVINNNQNQKENVHLKKLETFFYFTCVSFVSVQLSVQVEMRKLFKVLILLVLLNQIDGAPLKKPVELISSENETTDKSYSFS